MIADTIAILNKLGYKTSYSWSGHCKLKKELVINCDKGLWEEAKDKFFYEVDEIRKKF